MQGDKTLPEYRSRKHCSLSHADQLYTRGVSYNYSMLMYMFPASDVLDCANCLRLICGVSIRTVERQVSYSFYCCLSLEELRSLVLGRFLI